MKPLFHKGAQSEGKKLIESPKMLTNIKCTSPQILRPNDVVCHIVYLTVLPLLQQELSLDMATRPEELAQRPTRKFMSQYN